MRSTQSITEDTGNTCSGTIPPPPPVAVVLRLLPNLPLSERGGSYCIPLPNENAGNDNADGWSSSVLDVAWNVVIVETSAWVKRTEGE